ncbi:MAG: hypothetical protein DMD91_28060 [Candidatus Rokuibacteriota bacterium]|nr:MAG: hypothetical protein DMD91_28060 [Candidatus Rokubacteria bacterium]
MYHDRLREVYDRLAYHYSRTDETAKAVEYLMSFAEKSARAYAHDEAVKALGEAGHLVERLSTVARDRKKLELAIALPASLLPLGRLVEIFSVLLEQRERLERVNDPALSARYYFLLSRAYILSRHDVAGEHARRAIAEAERCGDTATMGRAYGVLAMGGALSGQAARGIEHGRRAVTLLEKTDSQSSLCYAYWALGLCYSQTGAFEEAIEAESQALQIAVKIGDLPLEGSAAWVLGIIHAAMGDFEDGVAHCERAVQKARDTLNRAIATGFLGYAYLQQGDLPRAIDALEKSIPSLHQFGLRAFEAWFTALLAEAHGLAGHFDRAEPLSAQALQIAAESNFGLALGCAHQAASRVALARGDHDAATKQSTDALAVFTRVHARSEAARTHLDLATISRARGDVAVHRRARRVHARPRSIRGRSDASGPRHDLSRARRRRGRAPASDRGPCALRCARSAEVSRARRPVGGRVGDATRHVTLTSRESARAPVAHPAPSGSTPGGDEPVDSNLWVWRWAAPSSSHRASSRAAAVVPWR